MTDLTDEQAAKIVAEWMGWGVVKNAIGNAVWDDPECVSAYRPFHDRNALHLVQAKIAESESLTFDFAHHLGIGWLNFSSMVIEGMPVGIVIPMDEFAEFLKTDSAEILRAAASAIEGVGHE